MLTAQPRDQSRNQLLLLLLLLLLIPRVESPSQKPSILYRNQTRNEPSLANFRESPFGELDISILDGCLETWEMKPAEMKHAEMKLAEM